VKKLGLSGVETLELSHGKDSSLGIFDSRQGSLLTLVRGEGVDAEKEGVGRLLEGAGSAAGCTSLFEVEKSSTRW